MYALRGRDLGDFAYIRCANRGMRWGGGENVFCVLLYGYALMCLFPCFSLEFDNNNDVHKLLVISSTAMQFTSISVDYF